MRGRFWLGTGGLVLGMVLGLMLPAFAAGGAGGARRGRGAIIGTPISATYKGLTTTQAYQPMPTVVTPAGPTGDPPAVTTTHAAIRVEPITQELRRSYQLANFYTKTLNIRGIQVIGSDRASDWAFLEAASTLDHMFKDSPTWVTDGFARFKVRLAIIADVEYTMDLPENQTPDMLARGAYNDRRSRGISSLPWSSCGEENLLNLRGDPYGGPNPQSGGENITIHEFSHTTAYMIQNIQTTGRGRNRQEGPFWTALGKAFADANLPAGRLGLWNAQHTGDPVYASSNLQEYWAEGAQAWFNNANPNNTGGVAVRDDVKTKDPELAALLKEIYGDGTWRYIKTTAKNRDGTPLRPADETAHLAGFDALRTQFPVFDYNNSPRIIAEAKAATQPGATQTAPASRPARGQGQ